MAKITIVNTTRYPMTLVGEAAGKCRVEWRPAKEVNMADWPIDSKGVRIVPGDLIVGVYGSDYQACDKCADDILRESKAKEAARS